MEGRALADLVVKLGLWRLPHRKSADIFELLYLPSLRNFAQGRRDTGKGFVAGEAEVDEPFAVEGAGHRLQNPDASLAVLDQFVVGRKNACDLFLHLQRRNPEIERQQLVQTQVVLRSEEHTSELQSLMRISYSVFCLKK